MFKYGLYIFFVLLFSQQLYSQDQKTKQYSFAHYGTSDGLASNEVTRIMQDEDGYLWIGSNNGLQRFDGLRYLSFRNRKNDPSSIPHNYIQQLLLDKKNNLWILTGDGKVGIFDTKKFTYREVSVKVKNERVIYMERELVEDEEGNLFLFFHNHEFITWSEKQKEFSAAYNFIPFPSGWKFVDFIQQPGTKKYWIGRREGLAVYNRQTRQFSYAGHNVEKEGIIEKFGTVPVPNNLFFDKQGRLWFDAWLGTPVIFAYNTRKNELVLDSYRLPFLLNKYHETKGFILQKNGTIWVRGLGVFAEYLEKEKQFRQVYNGYEGEQSIAYEMVNDLFEDKEENIWVTTRNNGLYRFNPGDQFFTNVRNINRMSGQPGDGSVVSFIQAKQGTILAGAWGDGLYRYDSNFKILPLNIRGLSEKVTPSMWSMCLSGDSNTIWMGSQPGVWAINQATSSAVFYNPPIMKERTVRQIAEDKYGNLWMGTQSLGAFKWTKTKGKRKFEEGVTQFTGVPVSQVLKIFIDNKGYVWIATSDQGLFVIDPATDKVILHFGTKEPAERKLLWDGIASVLQYDDSTIVIAANGIHLFNTKKQEIVKSIGLPESQAGTIASMEKDKNGYLWVSATSGLFRINPQNKIFIYFNRVDGITNDYFIIGASYELPDGKLLFGADNQFVVFDPSDVQINDVAPDIKITSFKLMNESLSVDSLQKRDRIVLGPEDNSIAVEFSGLSYNSAYIIKYKLEGLDKDWKIADKNYQAVYSYLPPGTYTFLARSEDAEGKPSENITKLVIKVNPPFWQTWWFFCLLALLIAVIFYWLDKQRVNKLLALQKVRADIATNLHEDVNKTLNNINLLSEMARIKADKDVDRSKEYIEQISTKSRNMINAMSDIMWTIDPQNDNMEKSLLRMTEFADALRNRYGVHIELALDKKVRSLKLDMKTRHETYFIFKESLWMIVKYSGGKETLIYIDFFKNKLSMKLQDATAKLDKNITEIENSIKEMNSRAALINAELDVQCDKKGIAIILLVPVK